MIQRFHLGLQDYKARIHIELNKEPRSIDEAVQEAIIYTETMKNPNHQEDIYYGFNKLINFCKRIKKVGLLK